MAAMSGGKAPPTGGKDAARAQREARLAEALRANLKRRKAGASQPTKAPRKEPK
jgi:hypothetical protein